MYQTILDLFPQQIFLAQGNEETLTALRVECIEHHASVEYFILQRMTTDDAREIVRWAQERSGTASWLLVYADVLPSESANILLKTFEEPGESICIVLITPHPFLIPHTIRSRVRIISFQKKDDVLPVYIQPKKTLTEYIQKEIANDDEEASVRKAKATALCDALEKKYKKNPSAIQTIYSAKEMLYKANMPAKQVMEYLVSMLD